MSDTLYNKIGADTLRAVIEDFYSRIFGDAMIGFLFAGKDRKRLVDKEWEFTAAFLGAPNVRYTGRPIRSAHAASPILGGHFERRLQILREAMDAHNVDPDVRTAWIDHTHALRPQVTGDSGSDCDHDIAAKRLRSDRAAPAPDLIHLTPQKPRSKP